MLVLQCEFMIDALLDAEDRRLRLAVERCGWWRERLMFRMRIVPKGDPTPGKLAKLGARRVAARRALAGYTGRPVRFGLGAAGLVAVRGGGGALGRARGGPCLLPCCRPCRPTHRE